jgi:ankyrin repeat protein
MNILKKHFALITVCAVLSSLNFQSVAFSTLNEDLLSAVLSGNTDVVKKLLDNGADANAKDKNGIPCLHHATFRGSADIVKILLNKGADVNSKDSTDKKTALFIAVDKGYTAIFQSLLDNGADINEKDEKGITCLMAAAHRSRLDMVKILLAYALDSPNDSR